MYFLKVAQVPAFKIHNMMEEATSDFLAFVCVSSSTHPRGLLIYVSLFLYFPLFKSL